MFLADGRAYVMPLRQGVGGPLGEAVKKSGGFGPSREWERVEEMRERPGPLHQGLIGTDMVLANLGKCWLDRCLC